jgi:hypothetical protein
VQALDQASETAMKEEREEKKLMPQAKYDMKLEAKRQRIAEMQSWVDFLVKEEPQGLGRKGIVGDWLEMVGKMVDTMTLKES